MADNSSTDLFQIAGITPGADAPASSAPQVGMDIKFPGRPVDTDPVNAGTGDDATSPAPVDLFQIAGIREGDREPVPPQTAASVGRDIAAGAVNIPAEAVKGVGQLAQLATGDTVGGGIVNAANTAEQWVGNNIGSPRSRAQAANLASDLQDPNAGLKTILANDKGALADQLLPMIGSFALPGGIAAGATKLATVGKAAKALDAADLALRARRAGEVAGIAGITGQSAAGTFSDARAQGADLGDAYKGAGATAGIAGAAAVVGGGGMASTIGRMLNGGLERGAGAAVRSGVQQGVAGAGMMAGGEVGSDIANDEDVSGSRVAKAAATGAATGILTATGLHMVGRKQPAADDGAAGGAAADNNNGAGPGSGGPSGNVGADGSRSRTGTGNDGSGLDYGGYVDYRRTLESGGQGNDARNDASGALGPDQFLRSTWLNLVKAAKPKWAEGMSDDQIAAERTNPVRSAEMAQVMDGDNARILGAQGAAITNENMYAMHHYGPKTGMDFIRASEDAPMTDIFTEAQAKANPREAAMTKGEVLDDWAKRAGAEEARTVDTEATATTDNPNAPDAEAGPMQSEGAAAQPEARARDQGVTDVEPIKAADEVAAATGDDARTAAAQQALLTMERRSPDDAAAPADQLAAEAQPQAAPAVEPARPVPIEPRATAPAPVPTPAPQAPRLAFDPRSVVARTFPQFGREMGIPADQMRRGTPAWAQAQGQWAQVQAARQAQPQGATPIAPPQPSNGAASSASATPVAQPLAPAAGATGFELPTPQAAPQTVLQNRNRSSAQSVLQMQAIARDPNYLRLRTSNDPNSGAPMVFANGDDDSSVAATGNADTAVMTDGQEVPFRYAVVEADTLQPSNFADGRANPAYESTQPGAIRALNNGRTAGIKAAYQAGTAAKYRAALTADSAATGIPAETIQRMRQPVLVRLYSEGANSAGMGARSQNSGLGMTATEMARNDAALMDDGVIGALQDAPVESAANAPFVRALVGRLRATGQDVSDFVDAAGRLSQTGIRRVQAALMQSAYGDGDLVEAMFSSADTETRAIGNALRDVAAPWMQMRRAAAGGVINPDVDITSNLLQALRMVQKARQERSSLYDATGQIGLDGTTVPNLTVGVLHLLYDGQYLTKPMSGQAVAEYLRAYTEAAGATTPEADMLGEQVGARQILDTISHLDTKDAAKHAREKVAADAAAASAAAPVILAAPETRGNEPGGGGATGAGAHGGGAAERQRGAAPDGAAAPEHSDAGSEPRGGGAVDQGDGENRAAVAATTKPPKVGDRRRPRATSADKANADHWRSLTVSEKSRALTDAMTGSGLGAGVIQIRARNLAGRAWMRLPEEMRAKLAARIDSGAQQAPTTAPEHAAAPDTSPSSNATFGGFIRYVADTPDDKTSVEKVAQRIDESPSSNAFPETVMRPVRLAAQAIMHVIKTGRISTERLTAARLLTGSDAVSLIAQVARRGGDGSLQKHIEAFNAVIDARRALGNQPSKAPEALPAKPGAAFTRLLRQKSTKVLLDHGDGRTLYSVSLTPAWRRQFWPTTTARLPSEPGFEIRHKADVTGNPSDDGYVLIDNRAQRAARSAAAAKKPASPEEIDTRMPGTGPTTLDGLDKDIKDGERGLVEWRVQRKKLRGVARTNMDANIALLEERLGELKQMRREENARQLLQHLPTKDEAARQNALEWVATNSHDDAKLQRVLEALPDPMTMEPHVGNWSHVFHAIAENPAATKHTADTARELGAQATRSYNPNDPLQQHGNEKDAATSARTEPSPDDALTQPPATPEGIKRVQDANAALEEARRGGDDAAVAAAQDAVMHAEAHDHKGATQPAVGPTLSDRVREPMQKTAAQYGYALDDHGGLSLDGKKLSVRVTDSARGVRIVSTADGRVLQTGPRDAATLGDFLHSFYGADPRRGQPHPDAPELSLEGQTEAEAQADAKRKADIEQAERDQAKRDEDMNHADAMRGDFDLTGSDRAADANPDQNRLFEPAPEDYRSENRQLNLFLDSESDKSQRGPAVEAARRNAVAAVDDIRGTGTILGAALSRDYAARQRVTLVGQKVGSADDLAVLAQVYRDPRFETFRLIFTDAKGRVVSQVGLTSRLPGSAVAIVGDDAGAYLTRVQRIAKRAGAASYFMLHNHPSTNPTASRADIILTRTFAEKLTGLNFRGHVVIDTNQYTVIGRDGGTETVGHDFGQVAPYDAHEWLDDSITSTEQAMGFAKKLVTDTNRITLISLDHHNYVVGVSTVPAAIGSPAISRAQRLLALRRARLRLPGDQTIAVGRNYAALQRLGGAVLDAIHVEPDGHVVSLASEGALADGGLGVGALFPADRRPRVSPDTSRDFDYLRQTPQATHASTGTAETDERPPTAEQMAHMIAPRIAGQEGAPSEAEVSAALRQWRDTAAALGRQAGYHDAVAAGATRLPYQQWVQVRTPNFKRWWGYDWDSEAQAGVRVGRGHHVPDGRGRSAGAGRADAENAGADRPDTDVAAAHQVPAGAPGSSSGVRGRGTSALAARAELGDVAGRELARGVVTVAHAPGALDFYDPATGEPRVFFHGTRDDFTVFDLNHPNKKDAGWLGPAHYVSSEHDIGRGYASAKRGPGKPHVMPLFVRPSRMAWVPPEAKRILRRYTPEELKAFGANVLSMGYDGVATRFPDGAIELAVFDGNSLKSASDNIGTFNESRNTVFESAPRYVKPERVTRDMVALHNLSDENIQGIERLGGMPAPSIAIGRIGNEHSGFGRITLIGHKDLVAPERGTPVFSHDAYTATSPAMLYDRIPRDAMLRFTKRLAADIPDTAKDLVEAMNEAVQKIEGRNPTPGDVFSALHRSNSIRMAYARDVLGKDIKRVPMRNVPFRIEESADPELQAWLVAHEGELGDLLRKGSSGDQEFARALAKEYTAAVHRQLAEAADAGAMEKAHADKLADQVARRNVGEDGLPNGMLVYHLSHDMEKVGKREVDSFALSNRLDKIASANDQGYEKWLMAKITPLFGPPKVMVGRARLPATLDNIVDAMTAGRTQGAEDSMTFGDRKTAAVLGREFHSMDAIKAARNEIQPGDVVKAARERSEALASEYRAMLMPYSRYPNDTWGNNDAAMRALTKMGAATKDSMVSRALHREGFSGFGAEVVDAAREAMIALRAEPTHYFEAKPQRAVALDEFAGAVVPKNLSPESRAILERHGIEIREYGSGKDARTKATAALARRLQRRHKDIMFQRARRGTLEAAQADAVFMRGEAARFDAAVKSAIDAGVRNDADALREQIRLPGTTPPALRVIGVPERPVYTSRNVLAKMHIEHGIPCATLNDLPSLVARPAMVFASDTRPGRFVLVTSAVHDGKPVVVAVEPNGKNGRLDVVFLPSAYPKDDAGRAFERWIRAGLLRYADKQRSRQLATTARLQLPGVVQRAIGFKPEYKTELDLPPSERGIAQLRSEMPSAGMDAGVVQTIADHMTADWKGAPEIKVIRDMSEAPEGVRDVAADQNAGGATGTPTAFYHEGKVYLVASALHDEKAVALAVLHEVKGHYGLRRAFGDKLEPVLRQLAVARKQDVIAMARRYGLHGADDAATLDNAGLWKHMSDENRMDAAEEVLAFMAQNEPKLGFVRRAIAAIRSWLRAHVPGFKNLHVTDDEIIRNILTPASKAVEKGGAAAVVQGAHFSRNKSAGRLPNGTPFVSDFRNDRPLKRNPDYAAAKAGDTDAAARLVRALVKPENIERAKELWGKDAIFVPVHAEEASGRNAIPVALAAHYADATGGSLGLGIVQTNHAYHTGAKAMERLMTRAEFDGDVKPGTNYVLVDDVTTMGSTLADLAAHIQSRGGKVAGVATLTNATRLGTLDADPRTIKQLEARHGDSIRDALGIGADQLTGPEAQYLLGFKSADDIRGRAAKARLERQSRLSQKGVLPEPEDGVGPGRAGGTHFQRDQAQQEDFNRRNANTDNPRTGNNAPGRAGKSGAMGDVPLPWDSPEGSRYDTMIQALQDKNVDLKRVVQAIEKTNGAIDDALNTRLHETLYRGRAAARTRDFNSFELNPLMEQMRKDGIGGDEFDNFLRARHAQEANDLIAKRDPDMTDGGSGMTNEQADRILAGITPDKLMKMEAAADRVAAIIKKTRQMMVDYSLISQATADAWGRMFDHYVPLYRDVDDDGGAGSTHGTGSGFSIHGKETKSRTGSTADNVTSILANIALQRERVIARGEKNRVDQSLYAMAKAYPKDDYWRVDQPPTKRILGADGFVHTVVDANYTRSENVVMAKLKDASGNIVQRAIVFNKHDERALRMARSLQNLDDAQMSAFMEGLAATTRVMAALSTQYNPVFGAVNLLRDTQEAMINLSSTPLHGKQAQVAGNILPSLAAIFRAARAERGGKIPDDAQTNRYVKAWRDFQTAGGPVGFSKVYATTMDRTNDIRRTLDPNYWMKSKLGRIVTVGGKLKVPFSVARRVGAPLFRLLTDYNEAFENANRLAAFIEARKPKAQGGAGMSDAAAAALAKNLTVNFDRKGQYARNLGTLYAFVNAGAQGDARMGETLFTMEPGKPKTLRLSKAGKYIVLGGMLIGVLDALAMSAAGYDENDPPEWVRERGLVIPGPNGKYATIPMSLGYQVFPNLGRLMAQAILQGGQGVAGYAGDAISTFMDAFAPIGGSGFQLTNFTPTTVAPITALATNTDFSGRAVARVRETPNTPGLKATRPNASAAGILIAKVLNQISGGDKYVAGGISPTGDQIDYLLGAYSGGVGREALRVAKTTQALAGDQPLPPWDIPLLGRFYGTTNGDAATLSHFYDNLNEGQRLRLEHHGLALDGRAADAEALAKAHPQVAMGYAAAGIQRTLSNERKAIANLKATKTTTPEQAAANEAQINAINARMTQQMADFNARFKSLKSHAQPAP